MTSIGQEPNELEKLLADVRRTIRDNDLFIRSLKKEAVEAEDADNEEEIDGDGGADNDEYVEL